jgi:3-isopropylmalate/(R)-2-methylmalate dehydratase large subunit
MTERPRTLFDKVWDSHIIDSASEAGVPSILYVDLHLLHEVTSPQAFAELDRRGLAVRRPDLCVATMDHSTPTNREISRDRLRVLDPAASTQLDRLEENCAKHGIELHALGSESQGIVHVMAPELGFTQPGMVVVCGDSHTSTHGAFGALAFGIGTTEVGHVLATQCLLQKKPKSFEIRVDGILSDGVTAKDLILSIIQRLGVDGGTGHVFEYSGSAIRSLSMEGRMTVCNMSIEGGARAGMIAPDKTTFDYLRDRPHAPRGGDWDRAVECWKTLSTDPGAGFDRTEKIDGASIEPMVTWGTNPGMAAPLAGAIPDPASQPDSKSAARALDYMGLTPGNSLEGSQIDVVFLGSCTNGRIEDLRAAASVLDGRTVSSGVQMIVVPGSQAVRRSAEAEGLDEIFLAAGAEWRDAGCSMCLAMNGDRLEPGQTAVSTSNRNFEGRQGPGGRTLLASPLTAAASAIAGRLTDPRGAI